MTMRATDRKPYVQTTSEYVILPPMSAGYQQDCLDALAYLRHYACLPRDEGASAAQPTWDNVPRDDKVRVALPRFRLDRRTDLRALCGYMAKYVEAEEIQLCADPQRDKESRWIPAWQSLELDPKTGAPLKPLAWLIERLKR